MTVMGLRQHTESLGFLQFPAWIYGIILDFSSIHSSIYIRTVRSWLTFISGTMESFLASPGQKLNVRCMLHGACCFSLQSRPPGLANETTGTNNKNNWE